MAIGSRNDADQRLFLCRNRFRLRNPTPQAKIRILRFAFAAMRRRLASARLFCRLVAGAAPAGGGQVGVAEKVLGNLLRRKEIRERGAARGEGLPPAIGSPLFHPSSKGTAQLTFRQPRPGGLEHVVAPSDRSPRGNASQWYRSFLLSTVAGFGKKPNFSEKHWKRGGVLLMNLLGFLGQWEKIFE